MTIILPRAVTPGPAFLREVRVSYALPHDGRTYVTLGHPEAHERRGTTVDRYLRGIAAGLDLHQGPGYPRTAHLLYYVCGTWALDYGHPESLLTLPAPTRSWAARTQALRTVHLGVCLDAFLPASSPDRILTGTVGYKADRRIGWL
ncbi:hypothetical protein ACQEVM_38630 [Streptomyces sp. CA-243310]|uniref:hypothetical protein n=1 Tax=Streptomyces sp. CA-243310 TaxID=3240056 RepID=UPI003D8CFFEB